MSDATEDTDSVAARLVQAITRPSPMIADSLGLLLTADELAAAERAIVAHWVLKQLARDRMPAMGQVLECMLGE